MLLIWKRRLQEDIDGTYWENKSEKPTIDCGFAPLSFLISLLLWPLLLALDIRNRVKEASYRAEVVSRRSTMLFLLSDSDKKLLALSKTMSLREFRAYLESIGRLRKHSFVLAFAVTILLGLGSQIVTPIVVLQTLTETTISARPLRSDHDVGKIPLHKAVCHSCEAIAPKLNELEPEIAESGIRFYFIEIGRILKGFATINDGVPKVINLFQMKSIS
jgi:hypothetical protein